MKRVKPDDYYNDGIFEQARFGNTVATANHMTEEQLILWLQKLVEGYDAVVSEIDSIVQQIRALVEEADPENLLNYLVSMNMLGSLNKESETEYSAELNFQLRSVEYVQTVLVSSPNHYKAREERDRSGEESSYAQIMKLATDLYDRVQEFYLRWAAKAELEKSLTDDELKYSMLAQTMSLVRGNQYQNFRVDVLESIIAPHSDEIAEIYGIAVEDLIFGLRVMEYNLSIGRLDAVKKMRKLMDNLPADYSNPSEAYLEEAHETVMQVIGVDLFDVKKHSKWPDSLIEDLSLGINSDDSFYNHGAFNGWPVWELPIQRKPFIKINGTSYCFDYNNFFDNIYRSLQTAIFSHGEKYKEKWKESQTEASEEIVGKIFSDLLPGCSVFRSNHYQIKGGSAENDLMVIYKDVLFVIEVKAGSFTYTPAFFDLKAHKASLNALIQKAEKQCIRTLDYIKSSSEAKFYEDDALKQYSFSVRRSDYSQIYMLDVTVDDINEIAAAAEKIYIAKAKEDIISLSIDDLWVYRDYFDSPAEFIHYIKQRTAATRSAEVYTFDELDHLGLYINHNVYSIQAEDIGQGNKVHFMGYREELDRYYAGKQLGREVEKPKQNIPSVMLKVIERCVEASTPKQTFQFTNFLLDFSSEGRKEFEDAFCKITEREREVGRIIPATCFGVTSYCLVIDLPGIKKISAEIITDYVEANLLKSGRDQCYLIKIQINENEIITDVGVALYKSIDIAPERIDHLRIFADDMIARRIEMFKIQSNKKKVYPNDPCPCGSGKKYKKCCGRR